MLVWTVRKEVVKSPKLIITGKSSELLTFFPLGPTHCYLELYYLLYSFQDSSAMGIGKSPGPSISVFASFLQDPLGLERDKCLFW